MSQPKSPPRFVVVTRIDDSLPLHEHLATQGTARWASLTGHVAVVRLRSDARQPKVFYDSLRYMPGAEAIVWQRGDLRVGPTARSPYRRALTLAQAEARRLNAGVDQAPLDAAASALMAYPEWHGTWEQARAAIIMLSTSRDVAP